MQAMKLNSLNQIIFIIKRLNQNCDRHYDQYYSKLKNSRTVCNNNLYIIYFIYIYIYNLLLKTVREFFSNKSTLLENIV